jgi:ribonuclease J
LSRGRFFEHITNEDIMRVCIHRGSQQIGGSCVELESQGKRLIVDLGLPLDSETNDSKYLLPIAGLQGGDSSLLGVLISHAHLDHFGLLQHISPSIPIGVGPAARRIVKAASQFISDRSWTIADGWDYESGKPLKIGPFCVTPFLVDHAAFDAYAFVIEADGRRLFYSGDLRAHGRKGKLFDWLVLNPPSPIDVMLLEGSAIGRIGEDMRYPTEDDIENRLIDIFKETSGLAMVHASAQNIDRVVSIFCASKQTDRRLIIDLYAAAILEATKHESIPQSHWKEVVLWVPEIQRKFIKEQQLFDLLKRHSTHRVFDEDIVGHEGEFTLLFRPLYARDLKMYNLLNGAAYIFSQWEGYWTDGTYDNVKAFISENNITKQSVHTSGHACVQDLQKLVEAMKPGRVVPIHSFHPERYTELYNNVELHADGEWWEV